MDARSEHVSKGSVLVVDDDEFARDLLSRRLQRAGYLVTATADGGKAPELLATGAFHLVLLDLVMPAIDGREVLAAIRERYSPSEVPVVMVTSKNDVHEIAECFRRGANDYVTKPFEPQALFARIDAHIARREAEAALKRSQDELERRVEQRTSELQRANRELEDARNILTDALEAINDGFVLWDRDDRLVTCNRRYREYFGRNSDAVKPGARFQDLMRIQAESGALRDALGQTAQWLERRLARHRDLSESFEVEFSSGAWVRVNESRTSNGRTVGLCTDITEIKRREIAFRTFADTNRRLAAAVNATASAVLITDPLRPGNPTVFANPAFTSMTGWPVEEVLGRDRNMLVGDETDPTGVERLERSIRAGVPASAELKLYAMDGRQFWAEINASPIRRNSGEIVNWVIIQTDITDRKETEEKLNQSQKMEMVGQLTGGLAHDFNNLLTVVLGNLESVLSRETPPEGEIREHIDAAFKASRRGAELTRRMLAFARRQTLAPRSTNLRQTIDGFRDFLGRSLGKATTLDCVVGEELWPVMVDQAQLENAILNLAVNARDAMGDSGTVTLRVANKSVRGMTDVTGRQVDDGDYAYISVGDTGAGMTPDVIAKAVQPFFTTKESGKGTGLGLSMVYGFASQSRGFMKIDSEPGKGSVIGLYIPRADACFPAPAPSLGQHVVGGSETILLVDDEPQVRTIAAIQLHRLGYQVLQAEDGADALNILDREPQVDLLVTDIGLPGIMNGLDLVAEIRGLRPGMPVLYVSGYADSKSSDSAEQDPEAQFLAKPYDCQALAAAVRRSLESAGR